ncbi:MULTISPECIES: hypothetical protein [Photobacterium]|uniref:Lipoprotein n=1 Tax=Photobacterium halotolerans TaxID=265726 RepID=A0A0F5VBY7_9GAMM|nr:MULTISPECIES: hypothetical protein [Photobacterium]KKC99680.1 hypothetical protein KY46_12270 [Photobacterium halotolerans]UIP29985.1 hypothetical protein LN341_20740 [Photobacterium sp. TLY01]
MKQTKMLSMVLLSLMLTACGGDSTGPVINQDNLMNNSNTTSNNDTSHSDSDTTTSIDIDGIYVDVDNNVVMMVDEDTEDGGFVLLDTDDSAVVMNTSHTISGTRMTATGISYLSSSAYSMNMEDSVTLTFYRQSVSFMGVINDQLTSYSLDRNSGSLSLETLDGTYTNSETGDTFSIDVAGNFTINGGCTISGTVYQKKHYYRDDAASVTGCSDATFDRDDYQFILFTLIVGDTNYLVTIADSSVATLWRLMPLEETL